MSIDKITEQLMCENSWYQSAIKKAKLHSLAKKIGYDTVETTSGSTAVMLQPSNVQLALLSSLHYRLDTLESKLTIVLAKQQGSHILNSLNDITDNLSKLSIGTSISTPQPIKKKHHPTPFYILVSHLEI